VWGAIGGFICLVLILWILLSRKENHDKAKFLATVVLTVITGLLMVRDAPDKNYMIYRSFAIDSMQRDSHYLDELRADMNGRWKKKSMLISKAKFDQDKIYLENEQQLLAKVEFQRFDEKGIASYVRYSDELLKQRVLVGNQQRIFKEVMTKEGEFYVVSPRRLNEVKSSLNLERKSMDALLKSQRDDYYLGLKNPDSSAQNNYDYQKEQKEDAHLFSTVGK